MKDIKDINPAFKLFSKRYNHFVFVLILFVFFTTHAYANFDFNSNCLKAYQNIFELKLSSARQIIAAEKKVHPGNAIVPLLENYIDYFHLLTTESKIDFDRLKDRKSSRLDQIAADDDVRSPYYLYAQAEINLQWAMIRGRFGDYFAAAREINKANSLLLENQRKFPGFQMNSKGLGTINAFLGNLPDGMLKSTLSAFGIKGNLQTGIAMLDKLAEILPKSTYEPFYEEVVFYYAFVVTDVSKRPDAYPKLMKYTDRISDGSLLKTYIQSYVCYKSGHNDQAIDILLKKPAGHNYQPFAYLDLLMGFALLNKLDYAAGNYFIKFLNSNKGVNYIKDANLHLAWISCLKADKRGYNAFISKVKIDGYTYHEKDKQALSEASNPLPNAELLKARLLFDGGYFSNALNVFSRNNVEKFNNSRDKTEFYYRLGRVNNEMGKDEIALLNYLNAINLGKDLKDYFASNAALQMGIIYERRNNKPKAITYYNIALKMKDHEYKNSIDAQAKAGLKRSGY